MRLRILALAGHLNPPPATVCQARKPLRRLLGISLIEALVCLGLIALAATVLVRILPSARQGTISYEHHLDAAFLGRTLLEQARSQGFEEVSPREGKLVQTEVRDQVESLQEFLYSLEVTSPAPSQKNVWVTVSWREPNGQKSLVIETILTER